MDTRPYLENNHSKKGWGCGSSGQAPDQHVQGPELKAIKKISQKMNIWKTK
jgi:hypothetical protein